jgi:hypothetical protein
MNRMAEKTKEMPPEIAAAYAKTSKQRSSDAVLIDAIMGAIGEELRPILKKLGERLDALEARPQMKYCGVYAAHTDYVEGNTVTDSGSLWHCNQPTRSRPGEVAGVWTLAVKRGADGRR